MLNFEIKVFRMRIIVFNSTEHVLKIYITISSNSQTELITRKKKPQNKKIFRTHVPQAVQSNISDLIFHHKFYELL